MAKTLLNATKQNEALVLTGFDTEVKAKNDAAGIQKKDELSGLPLWTIKAGLKIGETFTLSGVSITIAAAVSPVIKEETKYKAEGDLYVSPYAAQSGFGVNFTVILVGSLVEVQAGKGFPNKD